MVFLKTRYKHNAEFGKTEEKYAYLEIAGDGAADGEGWFLHERHFKDLKDLLEKKGIPREFWERFWEDRV